ncbi:hypothetical protein RRG08_021105 [Elysia crispata]|uniref:Uncharacterized protein n=1 Tax=Elysia crispata TaxID=231223 RepID=A0AAE0Z5P7_9GAST|nr:hypothetical protein RRG08_021105 [Elysia crispata]
MERPKRERYIRDKYGKYYKSNGYSNNRASDGSISSSASSHSISSNCSTGSTNSCKLDRWSLHQLRRDDQSQWYHNYTCPVYDSHQLNEDRVAHSLLVHQPTSDKSTACVGEDYQGALGLRPVQTAQVSYLDRVLSATPPPPLAVPPLLRTLLELPATVSFQLGYPRRCSLDSGAVINSGPTNQPNRPC